MVATEFSLEELLTADELFATTTTTGGGIIPITLINDRSFSNSAAGEQTLALRRTYWEWHNDPEMSEKIDYDP